MEVPQSDSSGAKLSFRSSMWGSYFLVDNKKKMQAYGFGVVPT